MPQPILDIHTHNRPSDVATAIVQCSPWEEIPLEGWYALGIHPWSITAERMVPELSIIEERMYAMAQNPRVLAIGEAGVDHLCSVPLEQQMEVFRLQARLAERVGKPLIIHAVRATAEVLQVRREILLQARRQVRSSVPWIIHGFRGGAGLARQLIGHGFYLSFGERYQPVALLATPENRLFIETDESSVPILELYARAAMTLGMVTEDLLQLVGETITQVFGDTIA